MLTNLYLWATFPSPMHFFLLLIYLIKFLRLSTLFPLLFLPPKPPMLSFQIHVLSLINCYDIHMYPYMCNSKNRNTTCSVYSAARMHVFRTNHLVLDRQLTCSSLEKIFLQCIFSYQEETKCGHIL